MCVFSNGHLLFPHIEFPLSSLDSSIFFFFPPIFYSFSVPDSRVIDKAKEDYLWFH